MFEDFLFVAFLDAATCIGNADTDNVLVEFVMIAAQSDGASLRCELDGIVHQVVKNLLHLFEVGYDFTTVFEQ